MSPTEAPVLAGFLAILAVLVTFGVNQVNRAQDKRDAAERAVREADAAERNAQRIADAAEKNAIRIEEQVQKRAAELARLAEVTAENVRLETEIAHAEVLRTIAVNTKLTHDAVDGAERSYQEANHVNLKIDHVQSNIVVLQEDMKKTIAIAEAAQASASADAKDAPVVLVADTGDVIARVDTTGQVLAIEAKVDDAETGKKKK